VTFLHLDPKLSVSESFIFGENIVIHLVGEAGVICGVIFGGVLGGDFGGDLEGDLGGEVKT
jgi:hypothetical protein